MFVEKVVNVSLFVAIVSSPVALPAVILYIAGVVVTGDKLIAGVGVMERLKSGTRLNHW